jgi:hypothetical protein
MAQSYVSTKNGCLSIPGFTAIPGSFSLNFPTAQLPVLEMCSGGFVNRVEGFKDLTFTATLYLQKGTAGCSIDDLPGARGSIVATIDTGCTVTFPGAIENVGIAKDEGSVVTVQVSGGHYTSSGTNISIVWSEA